MVGDFSFTKACTQWYRKIVKETYKNPRNRWQRVNAGQSLALNVAIRRYYLLLDLSLPKLQPKIAKTPDTHTHSQIQQHAVVESELGTHFFPNASDEAIQFEKKRIQTETSQMVVLSILSKATMRLNRVAGPFLLRNGLRIRYALAMGHLQDNPYLDQLLTIPWAQKIISLEVHQEITDRKKRSESTLDQWIERTFDSVFGVGPDHEYLHKITDGQMRLKILESYLRPILVPNEKWSDVARWQFHTRFLKWAREQFLSAKYSFSLQEGFERHPKLRGTPQVAAAVQNRESSALLGSTKKDYNKLFGNATLPSTKTVIDAFGMQKWNRVKDEEGIFLRMEEIAEDLGGRIVVVFGSSMRFADIPMDTDVSTLSLEDLLEIAGAHVASCGPLNVLCNDHDIYQLWTKEYIDGIGDYLQDRVQSFDGDTVILDIGAGDGLLGHLIRQKLATESRNTFSYTKTTASEKKRHRPVSDVISVDDGSWRIKPKASVEKLGVDEAIKKYANDPSKQVIILCSWMPASVDWTASFRSGEVDEYILIGEYDDGNCGENWETWGSHEFLPENFQVFDLQLEKTTLFEADGYTRQTLLGLQPHHFSRFDSSDSSNSATVSFRRAAPR
jgi:hypothetical protein